jgi:LuxR family quorum-sensing system transcriptional regulator CciR
MSAFYDVQQFVDEANRVTDAVAFGSLLERAAKALGFDYFALVHHHINLAKTTPDTIHLYNYPDAWVGTIIERGYFSDDPMLAAAQKTVVGFLWTDIGRLIELTARHKEILRAAGDAGMGEGFTTPANVPGESYGSCSFGTRFGRSVPQVVVPAAHYVGCFAFETARKLVRMNQQQAEIPQPEERAELTQRQFDCVLLAARGKSDWDIGKLLGISSETAHKHIEGAKRRYNATSRTQLIIKSLYKGQLTFADIIG